MTRKKQHPFKTTSKKTGAILLIVLLVLAVGGSIFFYLAIEESDRLKIVMDEWRTQDCEAMIKDQEVNREYWKHLAIKDKEC